MHIRRAERRPLARRRQACESSLKANTWVAHPNNPSVCLADTSLYTREAEDDYEEYARKVIGRAYFIILNKIDELDGTNERLLEYYRENIEKFRKV